MPIGLAGLGCTFIVGAQFVGQILGDPLIDGYVRKTVMMTGGACILVEVVSQATSLRLAMGALIVSGLVVALMAAKTRIQFSR